MTPRCERNLAGHEEDCGSRVAYVPCGEPAEWTITGRYAEDWYACERHMDEALRDGCEVAS